MSDEEDSQEKCIIPDQQNCEIEELCSETLAAKSNIPLIEKLLDNLSEKFSLKEKLGISVSEKLAKNLNSLFTNGMEEEKF